MTQYDSLNGKLSNSPPEKENQQQKNATEVTLKLYQI